MLLDQPFARPAEFQAGAVHQQVQGLRSVDHVGLRPRLVLASGAERRSADAGPASVPALVSCVWANSGQEITESSLPIVNC
jgi:hypothetical protein